MPRSDLRERARDMRRHPASAERRLWLALRGDALGVRFRRQHPIPPFIADFACVPARLIVEVDGGQHGDASDAARDGALATLGWHVLRVWNTDVMQNLDGVMARIQGIALERLAQGATRR